jgi:uncharacterized protein (TIGR03435 family)
MRKLFAVAVGALVGAVALAQGPVARTEFEVASVKVSPPDLPNQPGDSCKGGPGTSDPGLFTCTGAPLAYLVIEAYKLQFYELVAPEWMIHGGSDGGYNIAARVPGSATRDEFRQMLQDLLAKRFQFTFHWGQKKYPEYVLGVGKSDTKMTPVPSGAAAQPKFWMDIVKGHVRLNFVNQPLSELSNVLSAFLTSPVVNETTGTEAYHFTLEFMPDDRWRGFPYLPKFGAADQDSPSLERAIKDQLGLTFEKRDGLLRVLVVDKVEKVPTQN